MAINISRKGFFSTINIDDKIDFIKFFPSREKTICCVILLIIIGLIMAFYYLENSKGVYIILSLALVLYGLKTLLIFKPSLLIRFLERDYFIERGFLGKKITHGNLSELQNIEIKTKVIATDGNFIVYWETILKWKNGKCFTIGEFDDRDNAETVAKELSSRFKIGYVVC